MRCFLLVRYFLMFYWMSEVGPTCLAAPPRLPAQGKKKETEAADAPRQSRVRFCGPGPREELAHQAQGPAVPIMLTSANKAKNRLSFFSCFAAPFTSRISSSKKAELVLVKFEDTEKKLPNNLQAAEVKKDASCSQHSFCEPGPQDEVVDQSQGSIVPTASSKEAPALNAATCSEIEELEPPVPDHNKVKREAASCEPGPREETVHQVQGATASSPKAKKNGKRGETTFLTKIFIKWFYPRLVGPTRLALPRQRRSSPPSSQETNEASTSQQRDAPCQRHVRFAEEVMVYRYDVSTASAKPKLDGLISLARDSEIAGLEAPVPAHRQQNKAKRHVLFFSCFGARSSRKKAGENKEKKAMRSRLWLISCFRGPGSQDSMVDQ